MPWIIPSHQAAVLPFVYRRQPWISALGMALGTAAPDLAFILALDPSGFPASHTLAGQLVITVPLVLLGHMLATRLVLPWLLPYLPFGAPFHFDALARARPAGSVAGHARVAVSGLLGGLTHIGLDGFTHGDHSGWAVGLLPALATTVATPVGDMPLYDLLQGLLTVCLGVVALVGWHRLARRLPAPAPGAAAVWEVHPASRSARARLAAVVAAVGVLGGVVAPAVQGGFGSPHALKLALYGSLTLCTAAVLAGALLDRAGPLSRWRRAAPRARP